MFLFAMIAISKEYFLELLVKLVRKLPFLLPFNSLQIDRQPLLTLLICLVDTILLLGSEGLLHTWSSCLGIRLGRANLRLALVRTLLAEELVVVS